MNKVADEYKAKYNLNYSVLATPAEGLSGRFTKMDRRKFGKIPGVTDRDYYVNSFHVDVKEPISIVEKIKCEAPFHAITRGGHITYVELDGEAQKNSNFPGYDNRDSDGNIRQDKWNTVSLHRQRLFPDKFLTSGELKVESQELSL